MVSSLYTYRENALADGLREHRDLLTFAGARQIERANHLRLTGRQKGGVIQNGLCDDGIAARVGGAARLRRGFFHLGVEDQAAGGSAEVGKDIDARIDVLHLVVLPSVGATRCRTLTAGDDRY